MKVQDNRYDQAVAFITPMLRQPLMQLASAHKEQVHEIRLRAGKPVVLVMGNQSHCIGEDGRLWPQNSGGPLICSYECLEQTFRSMCGYSVHTHQREITKGYLTLRGGHRAGLAATVVEREGEITSMKELSSINLRIARQVPGCSVSLPPSVLETSVLLVGGPGSGKTTLLRDMARRIAGETKPGKKVVLLDERGELAAMWDGIPQNDVGINTDVLNGFSKEQGMEMAVRSLSPQVVICDEIGSRRDAHGLWNCLHAGVRVMASVHASTSGELMQKTWVMELLRTGVFHHLVFLRCGQPPTVERSIRTEEWLYEMDGNFAGGHCHEPVRCPDNQPL